MLKLFRFLELRSIHRHLLSDTETNFLPTLGNKIYDVHILVFVFVRFGLKIMKTEFLFMDGEGAAWNIYGNILKNTFWLTRIKWENFESSWKKKFFVWEACEQRSERHSLKIPLILLVEPRFTMFCLPSRLFLFPTDFSPRIRAFRKNFFHYELQKKEAFEVCSEMPEI